MVTRKYKLIIERFSPDPVEVAKIVAVIEQCLRDIAKNPECSAHYTLQCCVAGDDLERFYRDGHF